MSSGNEKKEEQNEENNENKELPVEEKESEIKRRKIVSGDLNVCPLFLSVVFLNSNIIYYFHLF